VPGEFDLIARHFTRPAANAVLGVGDDAALLVPTPGCELAVSTDMLLSGRHFFADADPESLGHKALAVNLSDLAAMGAQPRWALLALALPEADDAWLAAFARGLYALAEAHGVSLVGGDTTRGPLNISITVLGEVKSGRALRRDAAQIGDDIWLSGPVGGAALALKHLNGAIDLGKYAAACLQRLHRPTPQLVLGQSLVGLAHAAIDISDGLLADLGHILDRYGVGAEIVLHDMPLDAAFGAFPHLIQRCALAGGDDYELCFTAPPEHRARIEPLGAHRIGRITAAPGCRLRGADGALSLCELQGFDHFG